jgi:hypothetical protein
LPLLYERWIIEQILVRKLLRSFDEQNILFLGRLHPSFVESPFKKSWALGGSAFYPCFGTEKDQHLVSMVGTNPEPFYLEYDQHMLSKEYSTTLLRKGDMSPS